MMNANKNRHQQLHHELSQTLQNLQNALHAEGNQAYFSKLAAIKERLNHLQHVLADDAPYQDAVAENEVHAIADLLQTLETLLQEVEDEVSFLENDVSEKEVDHAANIASHHSFRESLKALIDRIKVDLPYM